MFIQILSMMITGAPLFAASNSPPNPTPIPRCLQAIEARLQAPPTAPPPRAVGVAPSHGADSSAGHPSVDASRQKMQRLRQLLLPMSPDPVEFAEQFRELQVADPLTAAAVRYLSQARIPLEVKSLQDEPWCGSASGFYMPPPRDRVVICATGAPNRQDVRGVFIHEVIHAMQHHGDSPAMYFFHDLPGGRVPSRPALAYTMSAASVDGMHEDLREYNRLDQAIPAARRPAFEALNRSLAYMEKYFWMDEKEGRLTFAPKLTAGESPDAWWRLFEQHLLRDLHPSTGGDPLNTPFTPPLIKEWGRANPPDRYPNLRERITALQRHLRDELAVLSHGANGEAIHGLLRQSYIKAGRVLQHLDTYCQETQTHIFNFLDELNYARDLSSVEECRAVAQPILSSGRKYGGEPFSLDATPEQLDERLEEFVKHHLSSAVGSYGGAFDALHGYNGHPHIFNAANCQRYRHDFREEIPAPVTAR